MATVKSTSEMAPLLTFLLRERADMGRSSPMMVPATAFLHPADWHELQREINDPTLGSAGYQFRGYNNEPPNLFGMSVDVDHGIVEGWAIFFREMTKTRLNMRHFRCIEHEDCRKTFALGMACIAGRAPR